MALVLVDLWCVSSSRPAPMPKLRVFRYRAVRIWKACSIRFCVPQGTESTLTLLTLGFDVAASTSAADHCHTIGCRTPLSARARTGCGPPAKNGGYDIAHTQIITNLTPADMRKKGAGFDLPIVWGILRAYSESARTGRSPAVTGGSSFEWLQPGCG